MRVRVKRERQYGNPRDDYHKKSTTRAFDRNIVLMRFLASLVRDSVLLLLTGGGFGPTFASAVQCFKNNVELRTAAKEYARDDGVDTEVAKKYGVRSLGVDHVKPRLTLTSPNPVRSSIRLDLGVSIKSPTSTASSWIWILSTHP